MNPDSAAALRNDFAFNRFIFELDAREQESTTTKEQLHSL